MNENEIKFLNILSYNSVNFTKYATLKRDNENAAYYQLLCIFIYWVKH